MQFRRLFLLALVAAAATVLAAPAGPKPFADGDTVCWIGDSITHGGRYHNYVYLYYATRFPERKLRFVNCGISGDTASGGLRRLDWDVLVHKPTVAPIMMGMNDVNRGLYGKDNPDEANLRNRAAALKRHVDSMAQLTAALVQAGVTPIFILPSIYDDTSTMDKPNLFGVNGALGTCAREATALAATNNAGIVDFWGTMNRVNAAVQKQDPKATIVGGDRVHPGPLGHFVMAYAFLKAQGVPATVATMDLDAAKQQTVADANCAITELARTATGLRFVCLEKALPFPLQGGTEGALKLVPFTKEMNQEIFRVRGLAGGKYVLRIDGREVGAYTTAELQAGVNLATNTKTPQYKQAEEVSKVNGYRFGLESGSIRNIVASEIRLGGKAKDLSDPAVRQQAVDAFLKRVEKSSHYKYYKGSMERYQRDKDKEPELRAQWEAAMAKMYELNKPTPHTYELVRQ